MSYEADLPKRVFNFLSFRPFSLADTEDSNRGGSGPNEHSNSGEGYVLVYFILLRGGRGVKRA